MNWLVCKMIIFKIVIQIMNGKVLVKVFIVNQIRLIILVIF